MMFKCLPLPKVFRSGLKVQSEAREEENVKNENWLRFSTWKSRSRTSSTLSSISTRSFRSRSETVLESVVSDLEEVETVAKDKEESQNSSRLNKHSTEESVLSTLWEDGNDCEENVVSYCTDFVIIDDGSDQLGEVESLTDSEEDSDLVENELEWVDAYKTALLEKRYVDAYKLECSYGNQLHAISPNFEALGQQTGADAEKSMALVVYCEPSSPHPVVPIFKSDIKSAEKIKRYDIRSHQLLESFVFLSLMASIVVNLLLTFW